MVFEKNKRGVAPIMAMFFGMLILVGFLVYMLVARDGGSGSALGITAPISENKQVQLACNDPTITPVLAVSPVDSNNLATAITLNTFKVYIDGTPNGDTQSPATLKITNGKGSRYEIVLNASGYYAYDLQGVTQCTETDNAQVLMAAKGTATIVAYNDQGTAGGTTAIGAGGEATVTNVIQASNDQVLNNPQSPLQILACYNYPSTPWKGISTVGGDAVSTPRCATHLNSTWDTIECWTTGITSLSDLKKGQFDSFLEADTSNNPIAGDHINVTLFYSDLFTKKNGARAYGYESEDGICLMPTNSFNILPS